MKPTHILKKGNLFGRGIGAKCYVDTVYERPFVMFLDNPSTIEVFWLEPDQLEMFGHPQEAYFGDIFTRASDKDQVWTCTSFNSETKTATIQLRS